jgi:DNA-binding protein HU-beta
MNKSELIDAITKKLPGVSKKTAGDIVGAFTDTVVSTLRRGDRLNLVGFGTFSVAKRRARSGRNPRTGETLQIPASRAVRFSAGVTLKGMVNKNNKQ